MRRGQDIPQFADIPDPFAERDGDAAWGAEGGRPDSGPEGDASSSRGRVSGGQAGPLPPAPPLASIPSPTRASLQMERAAALAAALAYEILWILALHPHGGARSAGTRALAAAIPLSAALVAFAAGTHRGVRGLGQPVARMLAVAAGAVAFFAVATALVPAPADARPAFWPAAIVCMRESAVLAVGPAIAASWAFRRAFPSASVWRTAALGIACGALATVGMSIVCPVGNALHVLVAHGMIQLAGGLAGALVGRSFSRA